MGFVVDIHLHILDSQRGPCLVLSRLLIQSAQCHKSSTWRSSAPVSLLPKVSPNPTFSPVPRPAKQARPPTAHIPAILNASDTISLAAIYSRSASSVEKLVNSGALDALDADARANIAQYSGEQGLTELLKRDDVHAVIVALPISKQPEVIFKSLQAGKHVLSEVSPAARRRGDRCAGSTADKVCVA